MQVTINIDRGDLRNVINRLRKYGKDVREGAKKEIIKSVYRIESGAKNDVPVKTGRLRSSIHAEYKGNIPGGEEGLGLAYDELDAAVGTNVNYGKFVEKGTSKMSAQPYLRPNYDKEYRKLIDRLKNLMIKGK